MNLFPEIADLAGLRSFGSQWRLVQPLRLETEARFQITLGQGAKHGADAPYAQVTRCKSAMM